MMASYESLGLNAEWVKVQRIESCDRNISSGAENNIWLTELISYLNTDDWIILLKEKSESSGYFIDLINLMKYPFDST